MNCPTVRIEVLEKRIAPALFFVSAATSGEDALKVFKGSDLAGVSDAELAALTLTGADAAVFLKKGDTLVFDADGDRTLSDGDTVMLKVTGGSAMVFLSDIVAGANPGGFDLNEITGLFVSNKFKGTLSVDVNGSVITAIDAKGDFEANGNEVKIQPAAISQLTAEGQIRDSVLAGGSISKLTVGAPILNLGLSLSVGGYIATGTQTNFSLVSFDGGPTILNTTFEQKDGAAGPDISNVKLANGTSGIYAGNGGSNEKGKGGKGGSVKNVTVDAGVEILDIEAGRGGVAGKGKSGAGGNISNITYTAAINATNAGLSLSGGSGGESPTGSGGSGGSVSKVKYFQESGSATIRIDGGFGGLGAKGNGASGGSVSSVTVEADRLYDVQIQGGSCDVQTPSIRDVEESPSSVFSLKKGGTGGSVSKISVTGQLEGPFAIEAGAGGTALSGGTGGSVSNIEANLTGAGEVTIAGGLGGSSYGSKSGNGGSVTKVALTTNGLFEDVVVRSGGAGIVVQGASTKIKAGVGGKVSGIDVVNDGQIGFLEVVSGEGGYIFTGAGAAGTSGAVSGVTITNSSVITKTWVHSGQGGTSVLLAVGNGGDSGDVSRIKIQDTSSDTNSYAIYAGFPSDTYSGPGKGDIFEGSAKLGASMAGNGFGSKGGSVGDVSGVVLDALNAFVEIGLGGKAGAVGLLTPGVGGGGGEVPLPDVPIFGLPGVAGSGGDISGGSGKVGTLKIMAAGGGDGYLGTGGNGGSVRNINITEVTNFVHVIAAGNGGLGYRGGNGGSIESVKVDGDIGNFTQEFGFGAPAETMGGLSAGMAGGPNATAGSVKKVTAGRIAAIIAGQPVDGVLGYQNAVSRISGVTADVIGADLDGGGFSFEEGGGTPGFQPDEEGTGLDGDRAIDGLVLVLANSKSKLPSNAANLFEVPNILPVIL